MKKTLLLIASVMMGTVAAFAQWTKPVPEFTALADDGETIQYLYNVEYGGFLLGANDWNTRASLSKVNGYKMKFKKNYSEYEDAEQTIPLEESFTGYSFLDSVETKSAWNEFDCQGFDNIWCDGAGRAGAGMWKIASIGENKYNISSFNVTNEDGSDLLFGWAPDLNDETNTRAYMLVGEDVYDFNLEKACTTWAFVSEEAYAAWRELAVVYDAAENLKAQIEWAKSNGISDADLAEYQAVYDNSNSTLEELKAAAAAAYDKGRWAEIKEYFENIVQGEKNDVSGVFVNNDFSAGNASGWDITYKASSDEASNIGYQGASYSNGEVQISGFIEAWKNESSPNYLGDGSITQTIPALPAGKYMLAVDVIASNQGRIQDANNRDGLPDDVELFALASLDSSVYKTNLYTKNGAPEHFEFTFVHKGGSMTLGLRVVNSAEAKMPANWIAMDNLQLFYYGETEDDPEKVILDAYIAQTLASYPIEGMEDIVATTSLKEGYVSLIEEAQAATADYADYKEKITACVDQLKASIAAYEKFIAKVDEWNESVATYSFESDAWAAFSDFVQGAEASEGYPEAFPETVMEETTLTTAEIEAYIAKVDELYKTAFALSLEPGTDCTAMLTNASFAKGFDGWTYKNGTFGGLKAYPCVEVYENQVEVYQEIDGVPDGVYSLTCQAFERPAGNGSYTGDEPSKVYLYMNDYRTPVQNIAKSAIPEEEAVDYVNCFISGGDPTEEFYSTGGTTNADYLFTDGYVPNGMSGASYAFRAGRYVQEAYGWVEGGKMKIGLTSDGNTAHWVLWSAFKLTYLGKDAASILLKNKIEELTTLIEENADNMTDVAANEANTALENAEESVESGDGDEMQAALKNVETAVESLKANVAAVKEFNDAVVGLDAAVEEYSETASAEAIAAYDEISEQITDISNLTTAEVKALTEKVYATVTAFKLPANWKDASRKNPVDFSAVIVNSTFDTIGDFTGWSGDGFGAGGTTSTNAERYSMNFDTYQDIKGLPAGYYEVSVQGFYRQGQAANDYKLTVTDQTPAYNAYLYSTSAAQDTATARIMEISAGRLATSLGGGTATVGQAGAEEVVPNTMEAANYWFEAGFYAPNSQFGKTYILVGEDGALRIGVKKDVTITDDWSIFDNFKLIYYGTENPKITVKDITMLIEKYLEPETTVTVTDITDLIDNYLNQAE